MTRFDEPAFWDEGMRVWPVIGVAMDCTVDDSDVQALRWELVAVLIA
jgi:hypothetical protein